MERRLLPCSCPPAPPSPDSSLSLKIKLDPKMLHQHWPKDKKTTWNYSELELLPNPIRLWSETFIFVGEGTGASLCFHRVLTSGLSKHPCLNAIRLTLHLPREVFHLFLIILDPAHDVVCIKIARDSHVFLASFPQLLLLTAGSTSWSHPARRFHIRKPQWWKIWGLETPTSED